MRLDLVRSDLYRMARDKGLHPRDRIAAAKVLLHYPAPGADSGNAKVREIVDAIHAWKTRAAG